MTLSRAAFWAGAAVRSADHDAAVSDESLVSRFIEGEEVAFTTLVTRHQDRLYQFVRFTLRNAEAEAEDLVQEVFLQAYRALPSFKQRSSFRTWLYGIARNVCRHRGSRSWWSQHAQADADVLHEVPDRQPNPLAVLERHRVQEVVRGAIESLSAHHRAVVFLKDIEGLSYEEIAEVLGVAVGTVRSRLHNARALLAQRLLEKP